MPALTHAYFYKRNGNVGIVTNLDGYRKYRAVQERMEGKLRSARSYEHVMVDGARRQVVDVYLEMQGDGARRTLYTCLPYWDGGERKADRIRTIFSKDMEGIYVDLLHAIKACRFGEQRRQQVIRNIKATYANDVWTVDTWLRDVSGYSDEEQGVMLQHLDGHRDVISITALHQALLNCRTEGAHQLQHALFVSLYEMFKMVVRRMQGMLMCGVPVCAEARGDLQSARIREGTRLLNKDLNGKYGPNFHTEALKKLFNYDTKSAWFAALDEHGVNGLLTTTRDPEPHH